MLPCQCAFLKAIQAFEQGLLVTMGESFAYNLRETLQAVTAVLRMQTLFRR